MSIPRAWALIPARGGSKGIPRKNLQPLAGRPLLTHGVALALAHPAIARVIVSTDDEEIAMVARDLGAETPVPRPPALARDEVPLLPVAQHLLEALRPAPPIDTLILLHPTAPFRREVDIGRALERLWETDADCVVTLSPRAAHPLRARTVDELGVPRPVVSDVDPYGQRQELPPVYYIDGCVVAARMDRLARQTRFFGERQQAVVIDALAGFDIDTPLDLEVARLLANRFGMQALVTDTPERREAVSWL